MNKLSGSSVSSVHTAMTAGAVAGAMMVAVSLMPFLNQWGQLIQWIVFTGGIYYGMKRFREKCGGYVGYAKAANAGMQVAFFISFILAFFIYLMAKVVDPSIITAYLDATGQMLQAMNIPSGIIETNMQQMREMLSPVTLAFATLMAYSLAGGIIAFFCGFFVQHISQEKQQSEQPESRS